MQSEKKNIFLHCLVSVTFNLAQSNALHFQTGLIWVVKWEEIRIQIKEEENKGLVHQSAMMIVSFHIPTSHEGNMAAIMTKRAQDGIVP